MTNNQHSPTGKTFWDWASENPKTAIFCTIAIVMILLSLIYMNKPIDIGPLKINQGKVIHDTITKFKTDTQIISQPVSRIRFSQVPQNSKKEVLVKNGLDTIVSVKNQPANISLAPNYGVIGNDNKISISKRPRELSLDEKNIILQKLKNKTAEIMVHCVIGDQEALSYSNKIITYLQSNGYTKVQLLIVGNIRPITGQYVDINDDGSATFTIGNQVN